MKILSAPIQEYTTVEWRNAHRRVIGGIEEYYAPFARLEKGVLSPRAAKDLVPARNNLVDVVPQILARTPEEARALIRAIKEFGYTRIDFNLCCPFEKVTQHGYGAGMLASREEVSTLLQVVSEFPDTQFSVKLRLGKLSSEEVFALVPILNSIQLDKIVLHPRTAEQQFEAAPDKEAYLRFASECQVPVFYNGDILTNTDTTSFDYIMIGRGLLANPLLSLQIKALPIPSGALAHFHSAYVEECEALCQQPLPKLKLLWNYFLPSLDSRLRKKIQKSKTLEEYCDITQEALDKE